MCGKGISGGTFMSQKFDMFNLKYFYILSQQLVRLLTGEVWLEIGIGKHQYTETVIETTGRYEIPKG